MPNSNLRPLQRYELALKSGEFSEDAQQRAAMTYLDNVYEQIMDKKDWLSYNKKNIGWAIGLVGMTIAFWFLVSNFGLGMFSSLRN